mmetsp:Transcript_9005/g.15457  ORF Transcript_9005/g.15457 Transcript_9005/m.15457 type:complete len:219 (-) Transcript_9005:521-1177(-)
MMILDASASLLSSSASLSASSSDGSPPPMPPWVMNSSAVASMAPHTPGSSSMAYPDLSSSAAPAVHKLSKPCSDAASSCTASASACRTLTSPSFGSLPLMGCSMAGSSAAPPSLSSALRWAFSLSLLSMQMFLSMVAMERRRSTCLEASCGRRCGMKRDSGSRSSARPSGKRATCGRAEGRCRSSCWSASHSSPTFPCPITSPISCVRKRPSRPSCPS